MIAGGSAMLVAGAGVVGVVHTVLGVDHYVPIAAVGRAEGWSLTRTLRFSVVCGVGHVGSALALGAAFAAIGVSSRHALGLEALRADGVAYLLVLLGIAYAVIGYTRRPRGHLAHPGTAAVRSRGAWAVLLVFVVGPCEPLVPLILAGGASAAWWAAPLVAIVFGVATLVAMTTLTALCYHGLQLMRATPSDRVTYALAGAAVSISGALMLGFGL